MKQAIRVVVTRRFEVAPERVFDAWLKRDSIEQWMFGPLVRDEEIVHLALDPRVGGSFSFLVEREEEDVDHIGKYLEIARPRRLVFTWIVTDEPVGSRVSVDIAPEGAGCEVILTQELHPSRAGDVERITSEWERRFEVLASTLEE